MNHKSKNARDRTKYKNFRETTFWNLKKAQQKNEQAAKKFKDIMAEKFYVIEKVPYLKNLKNHRGKSYKRNVKKKVQTEKTYDKNTFEFSQQTMPKIGEIFK